MTRAKSYHHGDLRQALIDTALTMLEEGGLEGLSLRKIAARVGVSHAAPEHHFPNLRHLLSALAVEGFRQFAASMRNEMAKADASPAARMRAAMDGYLAFAVSSPHLFRLMFDKNRLDWDYPGLGEAGMAGRAVLAEICQPAARHLGLDTPDGRLVVEDLVWSQAHGHAQLVIDQKIERALGADDRPTVPVLDLATLLLPSG